MVYECARGCTARSSCSAPAAGGSRRSATTGSWCSPAPGEPGKLPFWQGDAVGRPIELGRALGRLRPRDRGRPRARRQGPASRDGAAARAHDLDELAAENLLAYLDDEREATGALPTDKRIVVERFRDELGDWRLCILTPVRRAGPRARGRWPSRRGSPSGSGSRSRRSGPTTASRSGCRRATRRSTASRRCSSRRPTRSRTWSSARSASSALFASRFRENAARALLLPRRRPGTRTPLWQQRQRAADLLAVASRYGSFPILLETYRECLSDVFDLPALREVLAGVARREIAVHSVETAARRPFASSLLFDYVAAYMYDGDAPLAERRAGALTLDRDLLRELLGQEELRELLDPDALADLELSLQALADDRQATTVDGVHDLLRRLGDLTADEVAARTEGGAAVEPTRGSAELAARRRAVRIRIAGEERWIAIEDVARYRDGVGRRRRRSACRQRSSGRVRRRSTGCWPAGRGPTARS